MRVTNYDRQGNVIPDLSKVVLPLEVSIKLWETMNPGRKARPVKEDRHEQPQN